MGVHCAPGNRMHSVPRACIEELRRGFCTLVLFISNSSEFRTYLHHSLRPDLPKCKGFSSCSGQFRDWSDIVDKRECEIVRVYSGKNDVILQNKYSRHHSWWVNPLVLPHYCAEAEDGVLDGGREEGTATP